MKRQLIMGLVILGLASQAMAIVDALPSAKEVAVRNGITELQAKRILSESKVWMDDISPRKVRECKKLVDALVEKRGQLEEALTEKDEVNAKSYFSELKYYRETIRQKECLPVAVLDLAQKGVDTLNAKLRTH